VPPLSAAVFGLPEWASRLVIAAIVVVGAVVLLSLAAWLLPRLTRRLPSSRDPVRERQRQTAVAVLATAVRYVIVIAAIIGVLIGLAGGGGLGVIGGSALLIAVVGFASQRFLTDVIAGFFILFEGQYGVGDFVRLEPSGYSGVVVVLGLRTTVLRDMNGDVLHVPNGVITAVRRTPAGVSTYRIEVVVRDPVAFGFALGELVRLAPVGSGRLFVRQPRVVQRRGLEEGLTELSAEVDVAPSLEWIVEGLLLDALRLRVGDLLVGEPVVERYDPMTGAGPRLGLDVP
jgi:hypothetical protein